VSLSPIRSGECADEKCDAGLRQEPCAFIIAMLWLFQ
jgi:hypothetical protein